ncbi:MAG: hypothetical protein IKI24_03465 [Clostridia bacterium]|nr:hypothetical protein [Clostridia bacterium]
MKRVSSVLTALFMLCAMMFSGAPAEETVLAFPMEGAFFSSLWEGTPYDALARRLLNGLSPVYWDEEHLRYRQDDSVAEEILVADTQDGGREYLISFRHDMCFSDGSPVTAGDYAFTILMLASPCIGDLGADEDAFDYLSGWDRYHSGRSREFGGVRVLGDHQLALTVSPASLPCFFESGLISLTPFPASRLFPGLAVYDEGDGAFIASAENPLEGGPDGDLLRAVLLDPVTGYLGNPAVTSGRYRFVSFDGAKLVLEENPFYKGEWRASSPLPTAYTCLAFACERNSVYSAYLRKAVALCLDRDELLAAAGIQASAGINGFCSVNDPAFAHPANALPEPYETDPDMAALLLEEDGWTLNEAGEPYDATSDGVRCRLEGGEIVRLSLSLSYAEDGEIGEELLDAYLVQPLARAGIELICEPLASSELERIARSPRKRLSDLMLITLDICPDKDLSVFFKPNGADNLFGIDDPELYQAARDTYRTDEGDYAAYFARWLDFQAGFIDALPAIPLYCREYSY